MRICSYFMNFLWLEVLNWYQNYPFSPSAVPDHSVLRWTADFSDFLDVDVDPVSGLSFGITSYEKFSINDISENFMTSNGFVTAVHNTVYRLEQSQRLQNNIDLTYSDLFTAIKSEMIDTLQFKYVSVPYVNTNKRKRVGKPWWSEHLSYLWSEMCDFEQHCLICKDGEIKKS